MSYYRSEGYFQKTPQVCTDLGELVVGNHPGRTHVGQRTLCVNLGLALSDMVTAQRIFEAAKAQGIGQRLSL
ncbi:MAG: hypothetical protein R3C68_04235 [Myxococcota bacterium]